MRKTKTQEEKRRTELLKKLRMNEYTCLVEEIAALAAFEENFRKAKEMAELMTKSINAMKNLPRVMTDYETALLKCNQLDIELFRKTEHMIPDVIETLKKKRKDFFFIDRQTDKDMRQL